MKNSHIILILKYQKKTKKAMLYFIKIVYRYNYNRESYI